MTYTSIVTMLMQGEPLQTILDAAAELLQSCLIIVGDDIDIIAFSKTISARDTYWAQALKDGYCSEVMMTKIYNALSTKPFLSTPTIHSGLSYSPDNITLKYHIKLPRDDFRQAITIIALPLEDKFAKRQQDLLFSFATLLKSSFFYSEKLPLEYNYHGNKSILQKLLNQNSPHLQDLKGETDLTDDTIFSEKIQILVFSLEFPSVSNTLIHSYANNISAIVGNDYATIYDSSIVTILQPSEMTELNHTKLLELAKQAKAKIGISWLFSGKENVYSCYKQAVFSIETARKLNLSGSIFTYNEMYIYSLVDQCHKENRWVNTQHPVLTLLKNYDTINDSCLYETLYCLLKCGMSSSAATKKLGIHKSTFYHRLDVLEELIPGLLEKNIHWQTSVMLAYDLELLNSNKRLPDNF